MRQPLVFFASILALYVSFCHIFKGFAANRQIVFSVCSQCYSGSTRLGIYATSNALKESGAVGCYDMTTEAAVAKLYYLFSCGYPKEMIKELMTQNLRGEISV